MPRVRLNLRPRPDQHIGLTLLIGIFCRETQIRRLANQIIQLYLARLKSSTRLPLGRTLYSGCNSRLRTVGLILVPADKVTLSSPGKIDIGKTGALEKSRVQVERAGGSCLARRRSGSVAGDGKSAAAAVMP